MEVNSPAFDAGLREGDVITHINGESVQGLLHIQVVSLILAGGNHTTVRAIPIESTTIKLGGRKRHNIGKMAKRNMKKKQHNRSKSETERKRRSSLFRKFTIRRTEQQLSSPTTRNMISSPISPSRSLTCLNRSLSSGDSLPASPTRSKTSPRTYSSDTSSQSSSPNSSTPNSPASSTHYNRPSSLHGLKHKLQTIKSPHRRKSVHNIPLSPLARTPSPSSMAVSPTRSPSPLTVVKNTASTQGRNIYREMNTASYYTIHTQPSTIRA